MARVAGKAIREPPTSQKGRASLARTLQVTIGTQWSRRAVVRYEVPSPALLTSQAPHLCYLIQSFFSHLHVVVRHFRYWLVAHLCFSVLLFPTI